jgi:hypothetical protein
LNESAIGLYPESIPNSHILLGGNDWRVPGPIAWTRMVRCPGCGPTYLGSSAGDGCGRAIRRFKTPGIPPINAPKVPVEPKVASGSAEDAAHAARVNADPVECSNFLEEREWLVYLGGIISATAVARSVHLSLAPSILKVLPSQAHT